MKKKPPTTIFRDSTPLTDEERAQLAKEWFYRTLDKLWFVALLGDRELTEAFRDMAESLKIKTSPRSAGALQTLLMHYAAGVDMFGNDRGQILDWLIDENKRVHGARISRSTMDNRISEAISKVSPDDLPEWAHEAINKRRAKYRGKKISRK